jgi:hypothetical protein
MAALVAERRDLPFGDRADKRLVGVAESQPQVSVGIERE